MYLSHTGVVSQLSPGPVAKSPLFWVEIKVFSGNLIFEVICFFSFYLMLSNVVAIPTIFSLWNWNKIALFVVFCPFFVLSSILWKKYSPNPMQCPFLNIPQYLVLSSMYASVTICCYSITTAIELVITVHCSANLEVHWGNEKKDWQKLQITSAEVRDHWRNKKKDWQKWHTSAEVRYTRTLKKY